MPDVHSGWVSRIYSSANTHLCAFTILIGLAGTAYGQLSVTGYNGLSAAMSSNGAWSISIPHPAWQFAGGTGFPVYSLRTNSGSDNIGDFQELLFDYQAASSYRTGSIRVYPARPVVLFTLTWNNESPNVSPFPVFTTWPSLFHLSYNGEFAGPDFTNLAGDSPWIFFDSSANAYVLSPASDFMTAATARTASGISTGISPQIGTIPAALAHQTMLVFGAGINQTIAKWGQALTDLAGKQRPANDSDSLLKSISYWTDNGATYYYNPGGPSYSGTLESVKAEFDAKGIGLGSLQLDSWWYPKGPDNSWSSHGGIWIYTASPALFQPDLASFQNAFATPLITHARWIDVNSPYRSQYSISGNVATDPQYWEDVAAYLQSSGVNVYEQDWLGENAHTDLNLTDPYAFLGKMAASMAKRGITIQYCMALPKHFLQATNYNNVTTIRTSQDRFGSSRWTNYFYSSRFASALGIWPFSDVFMSNETENLIAATLSAGPVGVGDAVGNLSSANLVKAVRSDGIIVKPDVSAVPLDSVYISDAQAIDVPMIASAWSDYGGGMRANYIFAYARGANTTVTIRPADYGITGPAYLYDDLNRTGRLISANSKYTFDLAGTAGYFVLMPVGKTGIAFLGDQDHLVTLGKKRIATFTDTGKIDVTVNFAAGEKQRTLFGYSPQPVIATSLSGSQDGASWDRTTQIFTVAVRPGSAGTAHIRIIQSFSPDGGATTARVPDPGRNR